MHVVTLPATVADLPQAQQFVEQLLEQHNCPLSTILQISLVVEEVFVNIASYAYAPHEGTVTLAVDIDATGCLTLQFTDTGVPFNPLAQAAPDLTQSAEDRKIGGLGIFLAEQLMDTLTYTFENQTNLLFLQKQLSTI